MHASPHRRGAAPLRLSFSPSRVLSLPLSSHTNEIAPATAPTADSRTGSSRKRRRKSERPACGRVERERQRFCGNRRGTLATRGSLAGTRFYIFPREKRAGPGRDRRSINHERTTGIVGQREVRPCALISNGLTEGPAADGRSGQYRAGSPRPLRPTSAANTLPGWLFFVATFH